MRIGSIDSGPDHDTQLLTQACNGDRDAFGELARRQYRPVLEYLRRRDPAIGPSDLEDMTQEVFARTWQVKNRFRGRASARTFLFAVAKNVLSEHWRQSQRAHRPPTKSDTSPAVQRDSPTELRELVEIVEQAVDALTTKQKQAFELVLIKDVPVAEAALQAGTSVKAIRRRAEEARNHLRQQLSACKSGCSYECPSLRSCPAESGTTSCLKFLIRKYL